VPAHVVQRGNNRQAVFYDQAGYQAYLGWLEEGSDNPRYTDSLPMLT
jgi:hypothetical protein